MGTLWVSYGILWAYYGMLWVYILNIAREELKLWKVSSATLAAA